MQRPRDHVDLALLTELSERIDTALAEVLPRGARVAFVNFPNISNVGDLLLWLGTRRALRRRGVRIGYACEPRTYHADGVRRMRRCDAILVNGGGNFGDLWRGQQQVREQVLADFPDVPTLQLPQSLHFQDPANLARMQELLGGHRSFTALWREEESLTFAREQLPGSHLPCPDMALALGPLDEEPPGAPTHDVLWLARGDKEGRHPPPGDPPPDVAVVDWLRDATPPRRRVQLARRANQRLVADLVHGHDPLRNRLNQLTHPTLARHHVRRGAQILQQGRVVVTDRLHAHVLALLLGLPHVVLDNSYGKVRATYDAWTGSASLAHWADSADEALDTARSLVP